MSDSLRQFFSGDGSFADRIIDLFDNLMESNSSKRPFKRAYIFEPLEERIVLNVAPTFVDLPDEITVVAGSSYHVALNGYDADGDALTFTANSAIDTLANVLMNNANQTQTENTSARMHIVQRDANGNIVTDFGYITFEFFENDAPNTTARIKQLIAEEFYGGILFHRIIDNFMIQGGDPTGTGYYGSDYSDFADEFSQYLRHNSKGILSMANSGANTNNSQFFITDAATPYLDDVHSIFAFLTSGYDVLEEVSKVTTDSNDRPILDVVMEDVNLFTDTENGVLRIVTTSAMANTTQTVTVKVDDGNGGYDEKEIAVRIISGNLDAPQQANVVGGETIYIDLPKLENMGDDAQISYYVIPFDQSHPNMQYEITEDNRLKITAGENVAGPQYVYIGVQSALDGWIYSTENNYVGRYMLTVVTPAAPQVAWIDGDNGTEGDGITSHNNKDAETTLTFQLEGLIPVSDVMVNLYANGVEMPYQIISEKYYDNDGNEITDMAQDTIASRTIVVETIGSGEYKLNDGTYQFTAKQTLTIYDGTLPLVSDLSVPVQVIVATVAPEFLSPIEGFRYDVSPGDEFAVEIKTNKDNAEGEITIELIGELPQGMAIHTDEVTGQRTLTWNVPEDHEADNYTIQLKATDGAGNSRTVSFQLMVQTGPKFDVVGNTEINEGDSLTLILQPSDWIEEPANVDETDETDNDGPIEGGWQYEIIDSTLPEDANIQIIHSDNGRTATLVWDTTEADGPGLYTITLQATDENGITRIKMFQVTVNEVNTPPYFAAEDFEELYNVNEHEELVINVKARDNDVPLNTLTYSLINSDVLLTGMEINPATGLLTWIPGEEYGGQTYSVTVRVTDQNGATAQYTLLIAVAETDLPPVFTEIAPIEVYDDFGDLSFYVEATDPDMPSNLMRYSLEGDVPEGMTIAPNTGEIHWAIPLDYVGMEIPSVAWNVQIKATEIILTQVINELGEYTFQEFEGLSTNLVASITIKSRSYEIALAESQKEQEIAIAESAFAALNAVWANYDRPGLPDTDAAALSSALRDMRIGNPANTQRQNATPETPLYDKNYNGLFRNPFSTVTFGIDTLGATNDADTTSENQENAESPQNSQPQSNSGTSDGQTYRARRPVSPSAFLRGIENGLSRVGTPLLDSLNNVHVDRAISEWNEASESLQSYYDSLPKPAEQSARDAALFNRNNANRTSANPQNNSPEVNRRTFDALRLK
jgi:peptidyl-prolyl cis-trans isomerase A (cyclophilin A)